MRSLRQAASWIAFYLLLVAAPLLLLLLGPVLPGAGFRWDLSMAFGFAGLAVMALQFVLTARFRRAAAPFGIDIIYYFHRWAAVVGIALLLAHYGILRIDYPATLGAVNPWQAPGYITAGRVALLLFLVVIVTSLWRRPLRIGYDVWRMMHALLATLAVLLAVVHVAGVDYYTATPWKRTLWIGYMLFWVALLAYVRLARPRRLLRAPYRVVGVRPERAQTWTLTLEPESHAGFRFEPGQFAWLTLRASPYAFREHPFSIASSAAQGRRLEFSIKALGDFTRTIGDIAPGEVGYVDGPYGAFSCTRHPEARGLVFIAAGVGIAPIMSMLRTLADRRDTRPLRLVYANVGWDDAIFRDELPSLQARLSLTVTHVLERPPAQWPGEHGRIDEVLLRRVMADAAEPAGWHYFICSPVPMSETVQRALRRMGVPMARVHFELFDRV